MVGRYSIMRRCPIRLLSGVPRRRARCRKLSCGHVHVTSKISDWPVNIRAVRLDPLSPDEATRYYQPSRRCLNSLAEYLVPLGCLGLYAPASAWQSKQSGMQFSKVSEPPSVAGSIWWHSIFVPLNWWQRQQLPSHAAMAASLTV
jgi:hypothetical protein